MIRSALFFVAAVCAFAAPNPSWSKPYPAHKIAGNMYYVGTEDLASFLFTTPQGHILVNSGLANSTPLLRESFRQLGFKLEDVKILLTNQAHFDHVAAFAAIQKISGAKVYVTEPDAKVMQDGARSDPSFGPTSYFTPVHVDRQLKDGDVVRLGGTELKVILTPGHTKGSVSYSVSYSTTLNEGGRQRSVLIANMETVVMPLVRNPWYPNIVSDFQHSFEVQKRLTPEIWVAAHASQYDMDRKRKAGSFTDPEGYKKAIEDYERSFRAQLAKEQVTGTN